jgi:hypothetical protein
LMISQVLLVKSRFSDKCCWQLFPGPVRIYLLKSVSLLYYNWTEILSSTISHSWWNQISCG